ncbi:MAG: ABC transporter permease [Sulfolobales archaeon]
MGMRVIIIVISLLGLLALLGPLIAPYDPFQPSSTPYQGISWHHPLGTDGLGRDILSQLLIGSRITLAISLASSALSLVIGLIVGLASSFRSIVSQAISAVIDSFIVIPPLLIMIFIASISGPSIYSEILAISLSYWPQTAKTYRAEALSIFERPYVQASIAVGGNMLWIIRRHVIPNMSHITIASLTYLLGISIVSESIMSFLGLGDQRFFSWGMIFYYAFIQGAIYYGLWQWILAPALIITLVVYVLFKSTEDLLAR